MTDRNYEWIDPAERQRKRIDATVRGVIEQFDQFELLSEHGYTTSTSAYLFYDVRDSLGGAEFRLIADARHARHMGFLAADLRRQLSARGFREVA